MTARADVIAFQQQSIADPEIPQEIPVYAQDWDAAILRIEAHLERSQEQAPISTFAMRCLQNAAEHLSKRLARTFRATPRFESEQVALSILKGASDELRTASQSLLKAAQKLKDLGRGSDANQVYLAGKRAHEAAEGFAPSA